MVPWLKKWLVCLVLLATSSLGAAPLIIGAEVRLGDPTAGQLVGRGFGNISTWVNFESHYSTPGATMDAVTPDGPADYRIFVQSKTFSMLDAAALIVGARGARPGASASL